MNNDQCKVVANALFDALYAKTDGPQDAAEVLLYVHILIWRNQNEIISNVEEMLDAYKSCFLDMIEDKGRLN